MTVNDIIGTAACRICEPLTGEDIGAEVVKSLGEAGYVVTPKVPTQAMVNAAEEWLALDKQELRDGWIPRSVSVWERMLAEVEK